MLKLLLCCISLIIAGGLYCCLRVGAMYDREMEELEHSKNKGDNMVHTSSGNQTF